MEEGRELVAWAQSVLTSDGDVLSEVLRLRLERLMEAEQTGYVNAGRHERTKGRRTWRNGFRSRTLRSRAMELEGTECPYLIVDVRYEMARRPSGL